GRVDVAAREDERELRHETLRGVLGAVVGAVLVRARQLLLVGEGIGQGRAAHQSTSMLSQVTTSFSVRIEVSPAFSALISRLLGHALVSLYRFTAEPS